MFIFFPARPQPCAAQHAHSAFTTSTYAVAKLVANQHADDMGGRSDESVLLYVVMELLVHLPRREHRCLAYLFGSSKLWPATWKDKHWPGYSLECLSESLVTSCRHPFGPSSVCTLSDDREFDIALARTVVMFLSPKNDAGWNSFPLIQFLYGHLCQSPSPSLPDNDERPDVIRLILENASLLGIVHPPSWHGFDPSTDIWSTAILAAIIRDLGRRLRDPQTDRDGEQLFNALARTEVNGPDGEPRVWDLGEWLRTRALEVLMRSSSSTAMQDVHDALCALYPLCELNSELRVHWDRIGYPGRPGDIFSSPFLDIGEFFAIVEDPLSRREMYAAEESWDDSLEDSSDDSLEDSSDDSSEDSLDDE